MSDDPTSQPAKTLADQLGKEVHEALRSFFSQGWFGRLWTIQEYILSTHAVFRNESMVMDETKFREGLMLLYYLSLSGEVDTGYSKWPADLAELIRRAAIVVLPPP
jgi:hypothetical protein